MTQPQVWDRELAKKAMRPQSAPGAARREEGGISMPDLGWLTWGFSDPLLTLGRVVRTVPSVLRSEGTPAH